MDVYNSMNRHKRRFYGPTIQLSGRPPPPPPPPPPPIPPPPIPPFR